MAILIYVYLGLFFGWCLVTIVMVALMDWLGFRLDFHHFRLVLDLGIIAEHVGFAVYLGLQDERISAIPFAAMAGYLSSRCYSNWKNDRKNKQRKGFWAYKVVVDLGHKLGIADAGADTSRGISGSPS